MLRAQQAWVLGLSLAALVSVAPAGEADSRRAAASSASTADSPSVELFAGLQAGQIDVKIYPQDSKCCRLRITNKTPGPLSIVLPEAFAAAPILAQFDRQGRDNEQKAPQTLGVGPLDNMQQRNPFNNGQNNRFNQQQRPFFNLPPEKSAQVKLPAVCLEYGRPEPSPRVAYQLKPLAEVTDKPGVWELCTLLGNSDTNREAVQAAVWHLNNDLSWSELKQKVRTKFGPLLASPERLVKSADLQEAQELAEWAVKEAKNLSQNSHGHVGRPSGTEPPRGSGTGSKNRPATVGNDSLSRRY